MKCAASIKSLETSGLKKYKIFNLKRKFVDSKEKFKCP